MKYKIFGLAALALVFLCALAATAVEAEECDVSQTAELDDIRP